jgi:hypothetical protein
MTAIATLLDVTAKRGGAATLDSGHRMALWGRQRRAVRATKSRAEVAEHIRHFQPLACHEFPPLCSNLHHQYICGADHVVYYHGLYYSRRSR